MEDKIYEVTLEDGTKLEELKQNGNNFISKKKITEETFAGKLGSVAISDGETTEKHTDMELVQVKRYGTEYWFILRDITETEKKEAAVTKELTQQRADIDYIATMADIEL